LRETEFMTNLFEDFTRKECDLSLVIFLVVKKSVPANSVASDAINHSEFLQGIGSRRVPMMAEEVVAR